MKRFRFGDLDKGDARDAHFQSGLPHNCLQLWLLILQLAAVMSHKGPKENLRCVDSSYTAYQHSISKCLSLCFLQWTCMF